MRVRRWIMLILLIHAGMVAYSAAGHSPSVDEVGHMGAGLGYWKFGRLDLYQVNPPLVRELATIPVFVQNPVVRRVPKYMSPLDRAEFDTGQNFFTDNGNESFKSFVLARWACVPFCVLGGWICFRWSNQHYGTKGGMFCLILWCFSPEILANAAMITPDVGATAMGAAAWYLFWRWLKNPSWLSAIFAGSALGILELTKFTWIMLLFVWPVIWILWRHYRISRNVPFRLKVSHLVSMLLIAVYVINVGYGFQGSFKRLGNYWFTSETFAGNDIVLGVDLGNRFRGTWLAEFPVPLPENYLQGIDRQKCDFERGYRSYLMGEWKHGGWWYYYLIGFLVKEPIGFQLMLYVSILTGLWNWKRWTKENIREWSLIVAPPLLIFGLVSSQTGFNHHMRYVLPAYPFLFIIAARTVTLGKFWKWFSYACLTWQAVAVLWFAPHWMSYFNEAAGGPKNGHKWLVDSNIDWGQDILMLKWWQDKHPEAAPLNAAIFTMFDPKDIGLKFKLPAPFVKGQPEVVTKDGLRGPQPGWYALSVCMLKGMHFSVPEGDGEWSSSTENFTYFLDNFEPVDMIGYSIYIYHITEEDAARVRAKLLAEEAEFLKAKGESKEVEL